MCDLLEKDPDFDFMNMDTSVVSEDRINDRHLLRIIQQHKQFHAHSGKGLIAELCKRYVRKVGVSD